MFNDDTIYFSPEFNRIRKARAEKSAKHREIVKKKNKEAFGYIEKSIYRANSNGNVARLADNSQDVQTIQNEKKG